jgi:nucleotide-binding universal stress UspA family protein
MAIEVISHIARRYRAEVTLLHVTPKGKASDARRSTESIADRFEDVTYSIKIVEGDDPVDGIVNESKEHDLLVIGATRESRFRRQLFGPVPEVIAKRCSTTVLMVKKKLKTRFWSR